MRHTILIAVRVTAVTLLLTGIVYPMVATGMAQLLFPRQANGSMVTDERGHEVGSALIGQRFAQACYLQSRPSNAGWDATASSGSNLGPTSKKLRERAADDVARLVAENPEAAGPVPADLVTTSASGLDPHLSPEAALWQVPRIARARGVKVERVRALVLASVEHRQLGFLGEPRVNVLLVNLALDRLLGRPSGPG